MRDRTAKLMKEVCHNVCREPPLQPLSGESFTYSTAGADGARLDVAADEFWRIPSQRAIFDVKIVNSLCLNVGKPPVGHIRA